MLIKRNDLVQSVKKCMAGTDSIDGFDVLIIKNGKIHSFNDFISIAVPFLQDIDCSVRAGDFLKILTKYTSEELDIKVSPTNNSLIIKSGKSKSTLSYIENFTYSKITALYSNPFDWKDIPVAFMEGLKRTHISNNNSTLNGVFIDDDVMYSTDNLVMRMFQMDEKMGKVWIRNKSVQEMLRFPTITHYSSTQDWIHFKTEDDVLISVRGLIVANYPIDKVTTVFLKYMKEETFPEGVFPEGMKGLLQRAEVFAETYYSRKVVKISFNPEGIVFNTQSSSGATEELCEVANTWVDIPVLSTDIGRLIDSNLDTMSFSLVTWGDRFALKVMSDNYTELIICTKE